MNNILFIQKLHEITHLVIVENHNNVSGFNSETEASEYASELKKRLNLEEIYAEVLIIDKYEKV